VCSIDLAKPSIFNFTLRSRSLFCQSSSLACLASGCSAALHSWVRWRSVASLVCLAAGCCAALCTRRLSSLACLTWVCSDLCFWSLWRRRCSLAVAVSYRSRRNLSLALSVARVQNRIRSFNLNIRYMVGRTPTRISQCSRASVGLAQAHPNHSIHEDRHRSSYLIVHQHGGCFPFSFVI